ncbi:MAG: hypothetical protein RLZZ628_1793 [Bacteroidota bacterium]|jgi:hypothetical protein
MFKQFSSVIIPLFLILFTAPKVSAQLALTSSDHHANAQSAMLADYKGSYKKRARSSDMEFMQAVGGGILLSSNASAYFISYFPRIAFNEHFSVGVPLGIGFGGTYNSRFGAVGSLALELPLTADFNFGNRSTAYNEDSFGGFIGAGVGYGFVAASDESGRGGLVSATGLVGHGGLRFRLMDKNFYVRASYLLNLKSTAQSIVSLSSGYSF